MEDALAGVPEYIAEQPPGVVRMRIDPETGKAASPGDPDAIFELFLAENAPEAVTEVQQDPEARPESIF